MGKSQLLELGCYNEAVTAHQKINEHIENLAMMREGDLFTCEKY